MINCIIIDNNTNSIKQMEEYVTAVPFFKLLKTFQDSFDAIEFIGTCQVDVIFIEIEMPKIDGIQLIKSLTKPPMIVLVSSIDKYAIDGFQLGAVDYLLKPILFERFLRTCNKVRDFYNIKLLPLVYNSKPVDNVYDYIFVKSDYKIIRLNLDDILLIEGLKDYVKIHTVEKSVLSLLSLKNLETRLPSNLFIRVHRSYIVALNKIDSIEKSRIKIDKYYIPISDLYKDAFFKRIHSQNI